jgi:hypothetical protein
MNALGFQRQRRRMLISLAVAALAAAPSGCGSDPGNDPATQAEVMARWNKVPATARSFERGFNFEWETFDVFPHPTYKGGSAQAYRRFAEILVAFYEADDNFDFLARKRFFQARLRNVFPSGQVGIETNFQQLTEQMASGDGVPGDFPAVIREKLAAFATRIRQS